METSTIQVSQELRRKLAKIKQDLGVKSIEEVLERILKIVPASELKKEVSKK